MFNKIINKTINKGYSADKCQLCQKGLSVLWEFSFWLKFLKITVSTFDFFSSLTRIHKCKRCLRYICADCGSKKALVKIERDRNIDTLFYCFGELNQMLIFFLFFFWIRFSDMNWNQMFHIEYVMYAIVNLMCKIKSSEE